VREISKATIVDRTSEKEAKTSTAWTYPRTLEINEDNKPILKEDAHVEANLVEE